MSWTLCDVNGIPKSATAVLPAGAVIDFAGTVAPSGWLGCDGSAVSRATYWQLFAAIGVTHGAGNGTTTFNVPDARGRVSVGQGTHAEVSTVGQTEGGAVGNRTPKHTTSTSGGISLTGSPSLTGSVGFNDPGHTHSVNYNAGASANGTVSLSGRDSAASNTFTPGTASATTGITVTNGTLAVSVGTLALANTFTVGPTGTRPVDTPAYIVFLKVIKY